MRFEIVEHAIRYRVSQRLRILKQTTGKHRDNQFAPSRDGYGTRSIACQSVFFALLDRPAFSIDTPQLT
jgi:hypothetical protein